QSLATPLEEIRSLISALHEAEVELSPAVGDELAAIESQINRLHELAGDMPGSVHESVASSDPPRTVDDLVPHGPVSR
ncbi:MAG: hypothetical protein KIT69_16930, partial [Propionibacteriaceae bacterium]|nr:hypothetical protein [Propionibacteriaceae bacterium]